MTPVGTRPKPRVTAFIHRWQGSAVVYELVQYFFYEFLQSRKG